MAVPDLVFSGMEFLSTNPPGRRSRWGDCSNRNNNEEPDEISRLFSRPVDTRNESQISRYFALSGNASNSQSSTSRHPAHPGIRGEPQGETSCRSSRVVYPHSNHAHEISQSSPPPVLANSPSECPPNSASSIPLSWSPSIRDPPGAKANASESGVSELSRVRQCLFANADIRDNARVPENLSTLALEDLKRLARQTRAGIENSASEAQPSKGPLGTTILNQINAHVRGPCDPNIERSGTGKILRPAASYADCSTQVENDDILICRPEELRNVLTEHEDPHVETAPGNIQFLTELDGREIEHVAGPQLAQTVSTENIENRPLTRHNSGLGFRETGLGDTEDTGQKVQNGTSVLKTQHSETPPDELDAQYADMRRLAAQSVNTDPLLRESGSDLTGFVDQRLGGVRHDPADWNAAYDALVPDCADVSGSGSLDHHFQSQSVGDTYVDFASMPLAGDGMPDAVGNGPAAEFAADSDPGLQLPLGVESRYVDRLESKRCSNWPISVATDDMAEPPPVVLDSSNAALASELSWIADLAEPYIDGRCYYHNDCYSHRDPIYKPRCNQNTARDHSYVRTGVRSPSFGPKPLVMPTRVAPNDRAIRLDGLYRTDGFRSGGAGSDWQDHGHGDYDDVMMPAQLDRLSGLAQLQKRQRLGWQRTQLNGLPYAGANHDAHTHRSTGVGAEGLVSVGETGRLARGVGLWDGNDMSHGMPLPRDGDWIGGGVHGDGANWGGRWIGRRERDGPGDNHRSAGLKPVPGMPMKMVPNHQYNVLPMDGFPFWRPYRLY